MPRRAYAILAHSGGTTAIEYSLIAGLISIAIVGFLTAIGSTIAGNFYGPILGAF